MGRQRHSPAPAEGASQRGDILASFPCAPVICDVRVNYPLAEPKVSTSARCNCLCRADQQPACALVDQCTRDKYGRAAPGAFKLVPLLHEP